MSYGDIHAEDDGSAAVALVESGAELAGAAVGGAIGLVGGPPGAIGGAAAGVAATRVLKYVATELRQRFLAPREVMRVGATLAFAADKFRERQETGDEVRDDGFFDAGTDGRSAGEEIAEGVLIAAQRAAQERKLRFLGNLLANVAFAPEISRDHANTLLRQAEDLSYRQLLVLGVNLQDESYDDKERLAGAGYTKADSAELRDDLRLEIYDLYARGLVGPAEGGFWLGPGNVGAHVLAILPAGWQLARLMELDTAGSDDLKTTAHALGWSRALPT